MDFKKRIENLKNKYLIDYYKTMIFNNIHQPKGLFIDENILNIYDVKSNITFFYDLTNNSLLNKTQEGTPKNPSNNIFRYHLANNNEVWQCCSPSTQNLIFKGENINNIFEHNSNVVFLVFNSSTNIWQIIIYNEIAKNVTKRIDLQSNIQKPILQGLYYDTIWITDNNKILKYNIENDFIFSFNAYFALGNCLFDGRGIYNGELLYLNDMVNHSIRVFKC